jgi:hypothetical protein
VEEWTRLDSDATVRLEVAGGDEVFILDKDIECSCREGTLR